MDGAYQRSSVSNVSNLSWAQYPTPYSQFLNGGSGWENQAVMGDINGDGLQDMVLPSENPYGGSTTGLVLRSKLANGDGTWTGLPDRVLGTAFVGLLGHQQLADVNGDGLDDFLLIYNNTVLTV